MRTVKPVPFKLSVEDWNWGDEIEGMLNKLRDEIAEAIIEGTEFGLDAWLTDWEGPDDKSDSFHLQVLIYDEGAGGSIAEKNFPLSTLIDELEIEHPDEVAYKREKFQRLAEELETMAARVRRALDAAKDR